MCSPSLDTCREPVNGNIDPAESSSIFTEEYLLGLPAESHCLDPVASGDGMALTDHTFPELDIFLNTFTPLSEMLSTPVDFPWIDAECIQPSRIMNSNTTPTATSLQVSQSTCTKRPAVDDLINPQVAPENADLPTLDTVPQLSNMESDAGLLTPVSLDSPRFVATQSRSKRRRLSSRSGHAQWLGPYIQSEQRRCAEHCTPMPYAGFLDQQWLNEVDQSACKHPDVLLRIWVGISSAYSLVALRETLATIRNEEGLQLQKSLQGFSNAERVQIIEKADHQIASLRLLKRCHALKLWEDRNIGSNCEPHWLVFNSQHGLGPKGPGNPVNIFRCQATKALIETLYPGMEENTVEYKEKFNAVRRMEKLGQRLSMLTKQYGQGILGLLQGSGFQSATEESIDISDQMLVFWLTQSPAMNAADDSPGFCCLLTPSSSNF